MTGFVHLDEKEAKEVFRILRNIADDAHYCRHPKKEWPLYDHLAKALGENTLADHNMALRMRDEEEELEGRVCEDPEDEE